MDVYQPERRRKGRARERYAARQLKHQMVTRRDAPEVIEETPVMTRAPYDPGRFNTEILKGRALVASRDAFWYLRHNTYALVGVVGLMVAVVGLFLGIHLIGGRIFPNVWALGANIGDMTVEEAASTLQNRWANDLTITLRDGDRTWSATPTQLGMQLDATATAESARKVGLAGVPLGYGVLPVVSLDILTTQNYLLDLTEQTKILPYNAGYHWQGNQLVGIEGTDGRFLDVAGTLADLQQNLPLIAANGQLQLSMTAVPPDVRDPSPYLDQARAFASQSFIIKGYDPFTDETFAWTTNRDTLTSWLEAHKDGLGLREDVFASFVQAQTTSLEKTNPLRYVEPLDSMKKMSDAIKNVKSEVDLRVRYRSSTYTVQAGDSGYMIARRNGIPFYNLQQANPGRDWDKPLSIGDQINLPSPDITIPIDPVPNKRIVVNLKTQSLVAYEDGKPVFSWLIASGMDTAPTSPGVYEILSHEPEANGGSYNLCSSIGCAQWTMYWFMGIYEVIPGLVNGFHGAVLLPNGRYLGDGLVGRPLTYGCIMSDNDKAKALYDWAQEGTIVEIISPSYPPRSELGRRMLAGSEPG